MALPASHRPSEGLRKGVEATPNNYRIDWTEMPLPSLRGALATKQSRGRVMPPPGIASLRSQ